MPLLYGIGSGSIADYCAIGSRLLCNSRLAHTTVVLLNKLYIYSYLGIAEICACVCYL